MTTKAHNLVKPSDIDWQPFTFGSRATDRVAEVYVFLSQLKGEWVTLTRQEIRDLISAAVATEGINLLIKDKWFTENLDDKSLVATDRFFERLFLKHGKLPEGENNGQGRK